MNSLAEITRRLDNLIRPGTVAVVDHAGARCRVQSGELLTGWLPWFARRAGAVREWSAPSIGEQCVVLSPCGEMAAGFVLLGIYSDDNPQPATTGHVHRIVFGDGAMIEYDDVAHHLAAELPDGGTVALVASGGIAIDGNVDITGTLTASEDVIGAGISLASHHHGGVQPGSGVSGEPLP